MNKIFLSGNLTRDPEVRYTPAGKAYSKMGIAVNRPYSKEKTVDFFNLTAWDKTAEFCGKYLRNNYSKPANDSYQNRQPAPPPKNNYDDFGGEPIDPDDTPF